MSLEDLADCIRVVDIPLAAVVAGATLQAIIKRRYCSMSQRNILISLMILCCGLSLGNYHALGRPPYWPFLVANLVGLFYGLRGSVPLVFPGLSRKRISTDL